MILSSRSTSVVVENEEQSNNNNKQVAQLSHRDSAAGWGLRGNARCFILGSLESPQWTSY